MLNITFQHGALKVEVRNSIGMDELDGHVIASRLRLDSEQVANYRLARVTDIFLQSIVMAGIDTIAPREADGTPMVWPSASSSGEALAAWQMAILNLPRQLMRKWLKAIGDAEIAPGEDEMVQGAMTSEDPKDGPQHGQPTQS